MRLERRHALWLLIVAAHGSLLLIAPRQHPPDHSTAATSTVRLILPPPPQAKPTRRPAAAATAPTPRSNRQQSQQRQDDPPEPLADTAPRTTDAPVAEVPPTSETPRISLLQTDATQRAIREAGRQPLLSERAASASQDSGRETAQARLGREIQQAGTPDCLKGEFLGGGGGLLSLPFWLVAEARGKCKH